MRLPFVQYRDEAAAAANKATDTDAGRVQLLHRSPTQLAGDFRAGRIDAATVWEPHFSRVRQEAGAVGLRFDTIAVSDAIAMGHEGMHASLVSREVIADSVETVMHAERMGTYAS